MKRSSKNEKTKIRNSGKRKTKKEKNRKRKTKIKKCDEENDKYFLENEKEKEKENHKEITTNSDCVKLKGNSMTEFVLLFLYSISFSN